jgi:hypothetical protein
MSKNKGKGPYFQTLVVMPFCQLIAWRLILILLELLELYILELLFIAAIVTLLPVELELLRQSLTR